MKQLSKKEEYLTRIIHDLKTPAMAQICALKSLLESKNLKLSKDEFELVELTLNSCIGMKKFIETISNINKLNFSKLSLKYEKFSFSQLLDEVLGEYKILIKYNDLKVECFGNEEIFINADKAHLRQAVENLLSNSINCAFKKSKVEIKNYIMKNLMFFEIKTNSSYIDSHVLKEIFDKQKSHPSIYNRPSIGLGLYFSKEIINAHFGSMIAKSTENNVNVFGFSLPL